MSRPSATRTRDRWARFAAVVLLAVLGLVVASWAGARTVLLVYDDSGSMVEEGDGRDVYANYATQNLVALLDPRDRLEAVRMSAPNTPLPVLPERTQALAVDLVGGWSATVGTGTPYLSVQTTIGRLRDLRSVSDDPNEDFWLVVFSDGIFREAGGDLGPEALRRQLTADLADLRAAFSGRKLGVVFLGIGPEARTYADVWADAGAIAYAARTPVEITSSMFSIAAVITGRDPEADIADAGLPARALQRGEIVEVSSELPLRRLVVFEQGADDVGFRIDLGRSSLRTDGGDERAVTATERLTTQSGELRGYVTALVGERAGEVLAPGTFSLRTADVAGGRWDEDVRFLPEVALDLVVRSVGTGPPTCGGDTVRLEARLLETGTGRAIDLVDLPGLDMQVLMNADDGRSAFALRAVDRDAFVADVTVPEGRSSLSVVARFPGYFDLRSNLFVYELDACVSRFDVRASDQEIAVPATFGPGLGDSGQTSLTFRPSSPLPGASAAFDVTAVEIPRGLELALADRVLSRDPVAIELPEDRAIPLTVRATEDFRSESASILITLEPRDAVVVGSPVDVRLDVRLAPAVIDVVPGVMDRLVLSPSFEDSADTAFVAIGTFRLVPTGGGPPSGSVVDVEMSVERLPDGLALVVEGGTLADGPVEQALALGRPVDVELTARRAAVVGDGEVAVRLASLDPRVAFAPSSITVPYAFVERDLRLVSDEPWRIPLEELSSAPGLVVRSYDDERPVQASETARWTLNASGPSRLDVSAEADPDTGELSVLVRPARWPLFTRTGSVTIEVRATTPLGEEVAERFELTIDDMPFFQRWGRPIAYGLASLVALWLAIAWWRKPRFPRGAGLRITDVVKRSSGGFDWGGPGSGDGEATRRGEPDILFASSSIGISRFWPFGPQRAAAGPFVFRAARRGRGQAPRIYLERSEGRPEESASREPKVMHGLESVDRSQDFPIDEGESIHVNVNEQRAGAFVERREYTFRTGLRRY